MSCQRQSQIKGKQRGGGGGGGGRGRNTINICLHLMKRKQHLGAVRGKSESNQ